MQYLLSLWTINVYSYKTKVKTTQFYGSAAPSKTMVVRKTAHVFIRETALRYEEQWKVYGTRLLKAKLII